MKHSQTIIATRLDSLRELLHNFPESIESSTARIQFIHHIPQIKESLENEQNSLSSEEKKLLDEKYSEIYNFLDEINSSTFAEGIKFFTILT